MGTEVEKFEPTSLKDVIAEKIRVQFAELIPTDEWERLVAKEIENFTDIKERGYNNNREKYSDIQMLIREALKEQAKVALKKTLESTDWQQRQDEDGQYMASEAVTKMVTKHASQMVGQILGEVVQNAVHQIKYAA